MNVGPATGQAPAGIGHHLARDGSQPHQLGLGHGGPATDAGPDRSGHTTAAGDIAGRGRGLVAGGVGQLADSAEAR